MTVSFQLPSELAENLQRGLGDLDLAAKEALLVQAFRSGLITHYGLSQTLGIDRFETDALLQRYRVTEGTLTSEDLEEERNNLDRLLGPARS
ncbi:MAG: UPF0175 family protein [Planctomycetes bacterium]|nr:UPF0175 family protein [Planctomycetota bacterium]MBI3833940.1 UPF0175 family protein [Planctomycetota bacterium]